MPSKMPGILVRTPEEIKAKIEYIAKDNGRSASKEVEQLIKKHIKEYESINGEIQLPDKLTD